MNENDLLKAVLQYASKSIKPPLNSDGSEMICLQYAHSDFKQYLNNLMSGEEKVAFEQHASHCDICLYGLVQIKEIIENKILAEHALEFMKKYEQKPYYANAIKIATKWVGKMAWFVSLTGEAILQADLAEATRSKKLLNDSSNRITKQAKPQKILKRLEKLDISVEVKINTMEDGRSLILQLSFYDMKRNEFIRGLHVELAGGASMHAKTDGDGCADFVIYKAGEYDVFIMRDQEALIHFNLVVMK